MSRNAYTKSQVFLLEFIIAVLFFAICATVCVSAFVKSDNLSERSLIQNKAIIKIQSAAECIKSLDGQSFAADPVAEAEKSLEAYLGATSSKKDGKAYSQIYFDKDFKATEKEDAAYTLSIGLSQDSGMLVGEIQCDAMKENQPVIVKKYVPNEE